MSCHEVSLTGEVLMQIQELEEESAKVFDFLDDDVLRKGSHVVDKSCRQGIDSIGRLTFKSILIVS